MSIRAVYFAECTCHVGLKTCWPCGRHWETFLPTWEFLLFVKGRMIHKGEFHCSECEWRDAAGWLDRSNAAQNTETLQYTDDPVGWEPGCMWTKGLNDWIVQNHDSTKATNTKNYQFAENSKNVSVCGFSEQCMEMQMIIHKTEITTIENILKRPQLRWSLHHWNNISNHDDSEVSWFIRKCFKRWLWICNNIKNCSITAIL